MNTMIIDFKFVCAFLISLMALSTDLLSQKDSLNFNVPDSILENDNAFLKSLDSGTQEKKDSSKIFNLSEDEETEIEVKANEISSRYWTPVYNKLKHSTSPNMPLFERIIDNQNNFQSSYYSYLYISNALRYANNVNLLNNKPFDYLKFEALVEKSKNRYLYFLNQNYLHYSPPTVSNKLIKGVAITIDNDFLQNVIKNEDRNYTGGGRIEITTDYFKLRLFDLFWKRNIISYQTIFLGGEAYTPRVQYEPGEVEKATGTPLIYSDGELTDESITLVKNYLNSFHQNDRPFSSFYFIGRGKYRMHTKGHWRFYSEFKFGLLGSDGPKNVQAFIHRDLNTSSKKILLWENQIAQGGRYILNYNNKLDLRLYSSTKDKEDGLISTSANNASWGSHVYLPVQVNIGTELTSLGTGIKWQNRSIRDLNGQNELLHTNPIVNRNLWNYLKRLMYVGAEANVQYIVHNTMLEGVGIFKTFENDPFDDDKNSFRELKSNEVNRIIFNSKIFASMRFRNSCLTYGLNIISPEFNLPEKKWHAYGTVRFNFYI